MTLYRGLGTLFADASQQGPPFPFTKKRNHFNGDPRTQDRKQTDKIRAPAFPTRQRPEPPCDFLSQTGSRAWPAQQASRTCNDTPVCEPGIPRAWGWVGPLPLQVLHRRKKGGGGATRETEKQEMHGHGANAKMLMLTARCEKWERASVCGDTLGQSLPPPQTEGMGGVRNVT